MGSVGAPSAADTVAASVDVGAAGSDSELVAPSSSVVIADSTAGNDVNDDEDANDDADDVGDRGDSDCNWEHTSARMPSTACTSP